MSLPHNPTFSNHLAVANVYLAAALEEVGTNDCWRDELTGMIRKLKHIYSESLKPQATEEELIAGENQSEAPNQATP